MKKKIVLLLPDGNELHDVELALRGEDVEVFPAQTRRHALDLVRAQKPHLLIASYELGRLEDDGLEVMFQAARIQFVPSYLLLMPDKFSPIPAAISRDSVMIRPFSRDELVARIRELLCLAVPT